MSSYAFLSTGFFSLWYLHMNISFSVQLNLTTRPKSRISRRGKKSWLAPLLSLDGCMLYMCFFHFIYSYFMFISPQLHSLSLNLTMHWALSLTSFSLFLPVCLSVYTHALTLYPSLSLPLLSPHYSALIHALFLYSLLILASVLLIFALSAPSLSLPSSSPVSFTLPSSSLVFACVPPSLPSLFCTHSCIIPLFSPHSCLCAAHLCSLCPFPLSPLFFLFCFSNRFFLFIHFLFHFSY